MKPGDLVKRKPAWGEWTKYNPWMHADKDFEIGIVLTVDVDMYKILWPSSGIKWKWKKDILEVL